MSIHHRVLFLDDEARQPYAEWEKALVAPLARMGFDVELEEDPSTLPRRLREPWAAILLDLKFGSDPERGFALLSEIRQVVPDCPVVMLTVRSGVNVDLRCHAAGANGYVCKNALDSDLLADRLRLLIHREPSGPLLLGESQRARTLRASIALARSCDSTVLITGETGTGKEVIARGVHLLGPRWHPESGFQNFVAVNCAGVPETLWESEMFGHRRGAATGLTGTHCGAFLTAGGYGLRAEPKTDGTPIPIVQQGRPGTLFLDEVGELPLPMQAKLLRTVQERRVRFVGDPREYPQSDRLNVRIVAATNRDLPAEMKAEKFRTDLYYRLHVLPIHAPPLRERQEDLPALLAAFITARGGIVRVTEVASDVMPLLRSHNWPGNVRELENSVERAMVQLRFGGGTVLRASHFELAASPTGPSVDGLCRKVAEAILAGEIEPEAILPRPVAGRFTFGTLVYRETVELLRARGEDSQQRLADAWHLKPGSIGPLNSKCKVRLRRRKAQ